MPPPSIHLYLGQNNVIRARFCAQEDNLLLIERTHSPSNIHKRVPYFNTKIRQFVTSPHPFLINQNTPEHFSFNKCHA